MTTPSFNPIIQALPNLVPFVGPEQMERQRARPFRARLGANELAFGASSRAREVMRDAVAETWKYSDPENFDLRRALAEHYAVDMASVVIGEGIDGLLGLACMLFLEPGDRVVTTAGAYPTFNFHVRAHGGVLDELPMDEHLREDVPQLIQRARESGARIVYISNPNSPVGSFWSGEALAPLLSEMPRDIVVLLDEAYCELADPDDVLRIDTSAGPIIRLRTFSKAYGLAGARIGYAMGHPDVIAGFDKVRNHYGINRTGQIGAVAALADQAHLRDVAARVRRLRGRLHDIAMSAGLQPLPSEAAFVAMRCPGGVRDGAACAGRLLDELIARDIFVRKPQVAQLADLIRVSVGTEQELDLFAEVLPDVCASLT